MFSSENKKLWLASLILLLGLFLRLLDLQNFPLWTDEGWTFWLVENQSLSDTFSKLLSDRHPPLYFAILTIWQSFAGQSHLALRFPSLLTGLISLALSFQIAKRLFNQETALYSLLFLSILDITIYYSQELRHYGFFAMMSLWLILVFLNYLRQTTWLNWLVYSLSVTSLMLSHYFGLFVMLAQAFYTLFLWSATWKRKLAVVGAWCFAALLYLPWLVYSASTFTSIAQGVGNFPNSYQSNFNDFNLMLDLLFGGQILFFAGLYLIGLCALKWKSNQPYLVLAGIGLFGLMFLVNFRAGVLSNRMLFYLVPAIMILAAFGLSQLPSKIKLSFIPLILFVLLTQNINIQPRINADELANYLAENYSNNDYIVLETGWEDNNLDYEIAQVIPFSSRIRTVWLWEASRIQNTVQAELVNYERIWIVNWLHAAVILPQLQADDSFQLAQVQEFELDEPVPSNDKIIEIYLFERVNTENPLISYENGLILQDLIYPQTHNNTSQLYFDFWWQSQELLPLDYSFNLRLVDNTGQTVLQVDAPLAIQGSSTWQTNRLVFSRNQLPSTAHLQPNTEYQIYLTVYHYQDPQNPLLSEGQSSIFLGTFEVIN